VPGAVRKDMQLAVDQYLQVYQECKRLKDQLDTLKEVIEPYMHEYEFPSIEGTDGRGKVELSKQERPVMNARFTTYDVNDISTLLQPSQRKKCIVEVVDKDKLEALCKLGEVTAEVLEHKITKTSYSFSARFSKH
jgi:hypothetical protein